MSCSEVDPGEDTESDRSPACSRQSSAVAVRSIRERILKAGRFFIAISISVSCSEVDPGEDTESNDRRGIPL